jgi:hypothetical protein
MESTVLTLRVSAETKSQLEKAAAATHWKEVMRDPEVGIGKPQALRENLLGICSFTANASVNWYRACDTPRQPE